MRLNLRTAAVLVLGSALSPAARLSQPAEQAFAAYTAGLEERLAAQHARPETYVVVPAGEGALTGEVRVEAVHGGSWPVNGGLMHHWRAAALVPGATAKQMLALLRDYDHLARHYAPEVVSAHALAGGGERATLAMRFKKQRVVTVVLDAEFEAQSGLAGGRRGYSFSRSTHIWQVDQPGTPQERRRAEGNDDGYPLAVEFVLELRGAAGRAAHRVRSGFADARRAGGPGLADHADCGDPATDLPGVHFDGDEERAGGRRRKEESR